MSEERAMTIAGLREARYWRETEDDRGDFVADGQTGPPVRIAVNSDGIVLTGLRMPMRPSVARWIGTRLIEACGLYEAQFGGDGSLPKTKWSRRELRALDSFTRGQVQPEAEVDDATLAVHLGELELEEADA